MKKGFTLVEIMIVVAIIALLAALAIPSLLRSRLSANEAAAQATLQSISAAAQSFRGANPNYPTSLNDLENPASGPAYINLGGVGEGNSKQKQGYVFTIIDTGDNNTFVATAVPANVGVTGNRSFCVTEDGVIRENTEGGAIADHAACAALNPVQQ